MKEVRNRARWCASAGLAFLLLNVPVQGREIPAVGQPPGDFYNAQGNRISVKWELDRTSVPENEEITATLAITGAANPREVLRPDLRKLPAFESRFVIANLETPPPAADAKEVRFTYRLRPRNQSVDRVPTLPFHYYNPATVGRQFPMTTAKEVRITVTAPRSKAVAPPVPLAEPPWLLAYTPRHLSLSPTAVSAVWLWVAIAVVGPVTGIGWFLIWRRVYPGGARLARVRRSRAARRAADRIRGARRAPDPPAVIAAAVLGYLRARFPLAPDAVTPTEIGRAISDQGLDVAEVSRVVDFFRASDEQRFGLGENADDVLAADAAALIDCLEAA
jgi:hypothetical protein